MINDTVDLEKSRAVAKKIRAKNTVCFLNAFNALAELRLDDGLDGRYVEGWCAGPVVVAQHGWVELPNRTTGYTIIDPTPIYNREPEGRKYFPARSYTALEVLKLLGKRSLLPLNKDFRTWLRSGSYLWKGERDDIMAAPRRDRQRHPSLDEQAGLAGDGDPLRFRPPKLCLAARRGERVLHAPNHEKSH